MSRKTKQKKKPQVQYRKRKASEQLNLVRNLREYGEKKKIKRDQVLTPLREPLTDLFPEFLTATLITKLAQKTISNTCEKTINPQC